MDKDIQLSGIIARRGPFGVVTWEGRGELEYVRLPGLEAGKFTELEVDGGERVVSTTPLSSRERL